MNACNTLQKLGQRHVYHWVTSPFHLITLCNHLGTADINCCSFASGIFAHSWCIQDLSCSTVRGPYCLILLSMMCHTFSIGDRCCNSCRIAEIDMQFLGHAVLTATYVSPKFQHKPLYQWYPHI